MTYTNRICACIPFKNLDSCKVRLSSVLSQNEREQLMLGLLCEVSQALLGCKTIDEVWLFTADDTIVEKDPILQELRMIKDSEYLNLNDSYTKVAQLATKEAFQGMLYIHGDIPFISSFELDEIISSWDGDTISLFSDKDFSGTNAILTPLPSTIRSLFGKNSLNSHIKMLVNSDQNFEILYYRNIAIDIDEPRDLNYLSLPCEYKIP